MPRTTPKATPAASSTSTPAGVSATPKKSITRPSGPAQRHPERGCRRRRPRRTTRGTEADDASEPPDQIEQDSEARHTDEDGAKELDHRDTTEAISCAVSSTHTTNPSATTAKMPSIIASSRDWAISAKPGAQSTRTTGAGVGSTTRPRHLPGPQSRPEDQRRTATRAHP